MGSIPTLAELPWLGKAQEFQGGGISKNVREIFRYCQSQ